jgi:hypothetical protein
MQKLLSGTILLTVLGFTLPSFSLDTDKPNGGPTTSPAIHGVLVKMEGGILTVKAPTGRRLQLSIDRETKMVGDFQTGNYVQAWVLPDGRTESIIAYKEMGQSLPPQP